MISAFHHIVAKSFSVSVKQIHWLGIGGRFGIFFGWLPPANLKIWVWVGFKYQNFSVKIGHFWPFWQERDSARTDQKAMQMRCLGSSLAGGPQDPIFVLPDMWTTPKNNFISTIFQMSLYCVKLLWYKNLGEYWGTGCISQHVLKHFIVQKLSG